MKNIKQTLQSIVENINHSYNENIEIIERGDTFIIKIENKAIFKDVFTILAALDNVCFLNFYLEDKETFVIF